MIHRGQRLFQQLTDTAKTHQPVEPRTGRNPALNDARNKQLLHRYYYHAYIRRVKYEVALEELQKEFSLSVNRIVVIVTAEAATIRALFDAKLTTRQLAKLYPHFAWPA